MDYRKLGKTGMEISSLGIGTMNFGSVTGEKESMSLIHKALDAGVNLINTSDVNYSGLSEKIVGKALAQNNYRDRAFLSVEISGPDMGVPDCPNLSRDYIVQACDKALSRLGTEYIDLYVIPRPNINIPIRETLEALTELVNKGKIKFIATSTFPAWMVMEALNESEKSGLSSVDVEVSPYNLLDRRIENELIPLILKHNLGLITWAPLAQGVLAGRYKEKGRYPLGSRAMRIGGIYEQRVTSAGIDIYRRFSKIAKLFGKTPAQLAYLWTKDQPGVTTPIIGVRTMEQLQEFISVSEMTLSDDECIACNELNPPGSVVTDFFNTAPWMKMTI
jgi:1-deoxyxylulose-5-phosphate synthase